MTGPPLGKLAPAEFERTIAPYLGAPRDEVLLGPGVGRDSAIVRVGAGRVMALTTDPLSLLPALGAADSARLACHLLASDLWTSGIPPAYATVSFALPPDLADDTFAAYWEAMSAEFAALGIAVVAGHTGRYAGCGLTIVGAATLVGVGDEGRVVGTPHVKPGDRVVMTKDAAVEATVVAARLFPKRLLAALGDDETLLARARSRAVSVVADCRAALRVGVRDRGVALLHDATEGGVLGGLLEVAKATGCDVRIAEDAIPVSAEARAACTLFGLDPLWTLSEGTLLAVVRPAYAGAVLEALAAEGIAAAELGEVVRGSGAVWLTRTSGEIEKLTAPRADGYWAAYERAVREGWS